MRYERQNTCIDASVHIQVLDDEKIKRDAQAIASGG